MLKNRSSVAQKRSGKSGRSGQHLASGRHRRFGEVFVRTYKMPVWKRIQFVGCLIAVMSFSALAHAKDLKINIPKRSQLTSVQRLNREGVEAVNKHQFNKAKALFYKAYLYDPGDPFTLNNLGYIAELDGQVERAQSFYSMAVSEPTEAR